MNTRASIAVSPSSSRASVWVALALFALVAALYSSSAENGFVGYDDGAYITKNPHVSGGLSAENVRWAFGAFHSANWHPLTWLSHQLDVELFGLDAGPHHMVGAGLHALNALLCFAFLRRVTGSLWASALAALLFAVHPQRVESVAWASERKDVLSGTFFFLTLLAYARYVRAPSPARYGVVALAFALGLLAKPMLVTVPLVLLLLDLWPLRRELPPGRLALEKLPLLALATASAVVTLLAQRAAGAVSSLDALALDQRVATAVLATRAYLAQAFWPSGLAFFYPHPAIVAPATFALVSVRVLLGALLLAGLSLGAWAMRKRAPAFWVGWAWMLVMLLPVIGLVQVGTQFYADRYAYLPLLGPTLALVFGTRALVPPRALRPLFALGLTAVAACALVTRRQIGVWRDDRSLCERALAVTERNEVAHLLLGDSLQRAGELELARDQYLAALALRQEQPLVHSNLGAAYTQLGAFELAAAELAEALRLAPTSEEARLNAGQLCERREDPEGARGHYELAVRQHPDSPRAWNKLGEVQFALARFGAARAAYEHALELDGSAADVHARLALALAELAEAQGARAHVEQALRRAPDDAWALHAEAWVRATSARASGLRDPARAQAALVRYGERRELARWMHLRVSAAVLAAGGRFDEAARAVAEAAGLAPEAWWSRLAAERRLFSAAHALGD